MDLSYGPEYDAFRAELEAFVEEAWAPGDPEAPTAEEEEPGRGFFLNRPDMEELALLLRVGNEVELRHGGR